MLELFLPAVVTVSAVTGLFHGIASVVRAVYDGQAKLIRAKRGDPELPAPVPILPRPLIRHRKDIPSREEQQ